jgi:hypothetical protein
MDLHVSGVSSAQAADKLIQLVTNLYDRRHRQRAAVTAISTINTTAIPTIFRRTVRLTMF